MVREAAIPCLATAAALATAVAVVINPIVPSLPDVRIPALFPTQLHLAPAGKALTDSTVAAILPAIETAVKNLEREATIAQRAVAGVATTVLPDPGVVPLIRAAYALNASENPLVIAPPTARTAAPQASAGLAGAQRSANPSVAARSARLSAAMTLPPASPHLPPPAMAAVAAVAIAPPSAPPVHAAQFAQEPAHSGSHPGQHHW